METHMGIMDLFVKNDDKAAPAAEATPAVTPAVVRTNSRAGSATKGKAAAVPVEEEAPVEDATDGGVDQKILANLEQALTDATPKDYGYLQFRGSLAKMEKK